MRVSSTLSVYLGRQFAGWLVSVFVTLAAIVAMFDIVELLRRASGKQQVTTEFVVQMSLFKLPHLVQEMLPFAILIGSMLAFWRMAKANELVVARAAGVSVWQLLIAPVFVTFLAGVVMITAFNPFAAAMHTRYERLETKYLEQRSSELSVSKTGVWLRQGTSDRQAVIRARDAESRGARLSDVTVYRLEAPDRFVGRIDAEAAVLRDGYWELTNAVVSKPESAPAPHERYRLATELTPDKIQNSFASADTLGFWELPGFIETMETAGFNANTHRLYLHQLLSTPLLLCAMVLVAAVFAMRAGRRSRTGTMIVAGITTGFLLYFFTNVIHALGLSTGIPAALAAWMPAGVSTMLGITALLHVEDG